MPTEIKIELTPEAIATMRAVDELPERALKHIAQAFDYENQLTISHIANDYASFPKDGPPVDIGLRVQTGHYRRSIHSFPAVVSGQRVQSAIGSPLVYAAIHEFGGVIHHPARSGKVRLRLDAKGELLRQAKHPHLAVFASDEHERAKEVDYQAQAYDVTMPARAPIQRGIKDRLDNYSKAVSNAVVQGFME